MSSQAQHGMLPRSTHDEETRQIFTKSLRVKIFFENYFKNFWTGFFFMKPF